MNSPIKVITMNKKAFQLKANRKLANRWPSEQIWIGPGEWGVFMS